METITTRRIQSGTQSLQFGYWDAEAEEFVPVPIDGEKDKAAAAYLGCSEKLMEALSIVLDGVARTVHGDLKDIWVRLDALETLIKER